MNETDIAHAEMHQQQSELEQYAEELRDVMAKMRLNHGRIIGILRFYRDDGGEHSEIVIKSLLEALEEFEDLNRRVK